MNFGHCNGLWAIMLFQYTACFMPLSLNTYYTLYIQHINFDLQVIPVGDQEALPPAPPPVNARETINFPKQGKWRPESDRPKKNEAPEKTVLTRYAKAL